jgi:soluble lytic murein transglycosylase-like protein
MGATTRLYLRADASAGYIDVATDEIASIQAEENLPAAQPELKSQGTEDAVTAASNRTGLDPDLISSVIQAESGFNPHAVSRKGAQGLMQLMPSTAAQLGVKDAFNPQQNVQGGSVYLRDLLIQNHLDLARALAAYNAGPRRVAQYHGVPPYYETHAYVSRVIRDFNRKKLAQQRALKRAKTNAPASGGAQGEAAASSSAAAASAEVATQDGPVK